MITVDSIEKGIVIDHIKAGKSMEIYQALNLDELDCSVAIIKNVKSNKMGFKDIIKISDTIDLNLDVLGYIDPNITVNNVVPMFNRGFILSIKPIAASGEEPACGELSYCCDVVSPDALLTTRSSVTVRGAVFSQPQRMSRASRS